MVYTRGALDMFDTGISPSVNKNTTHETKHSLIFARSIAIWVNQIDNGPIPDSGTDRCSDLDWI
jgi:hypothetical protein